MIPEARFIDIDTSNLLAHVSSDAPIGFGLNFKDINPGQFLRHEFFDGRQKRLLDLLKPFVASAIGDFQDQTGLVADGIRRLDIINQDSATDYDSRKWHRDELFLGEKLYVAAEGQALTETIIGPDVFGFYRQLPYGFPINGLTNALVALGKIEVVTGKQGQTTVMTSGVVHRSGKINSASSRALVIVAIYNHEQARSEFIKKRREGRRLRRTKIHEPYGL